MADKNTGASGAVKKLTEEILERAERIFVLMERRDSFEAEFENADEPRRAQLSDEIEGADNEIDMIVEELEPLIKEADETAAKLDDADKTAAAELHGALKRAQEALELCAYDD